VGLADLLVSPLDAGAVGLTGIAGKAADGSGYQLVAIVDAHDLSLVSIGGRRLGVVDIAMAFRASDGQAYVLPAETQSVNLTDAQFAEAEAGFIIRKGINTEGQTGSIRIVVRDQATGAAGSVWIPAD
jgi:hypothetical protein